jgi:hypothetical protein
LFDAIPDRRLELDQLFAGGAARRQRVNNLASAWRVLRV